MARKKEEWFLDEQSIVSAYWLKFKMFLYYKPLRAFNVLMNTLNLQERTNVLVSIVKTYLTVETFFGRTSIKISWKSIIPWSVGSEMLA